MSAKKPVVKRAPRTPKEKAFAKEYIANGGNATQAALKVYDTDRYDSAGKIGNENTNKLNFDHYFAAAGLTDEAIAQNIARIAVSSTKRDQYTGEETTDDAIQLRASELAVKIMGKFAAPRAAVDSEGRTVTPILMSLDVHSHDGD